MTSPDTWSRSWLKHLASIIRAHPELSHLEANLSEVERELDAIDVELAAEENERWEDHWRWSSDLPLWPDTGDEQPPSGQGWVHDPASHTWSRPVDGPYPKPAQSVVRPHVRIEEMSDEDRERIWNLIKEVSR